ncbi:MAG TPA: hypothetical protein VNJ09_06045 [Chthonomonadales bacterium]|nr:hypothetical protein [Chthonomonadales bacterium]
MNEARISCLRCRANNFPGQTHCWQCGHSLPPPEAVEPSVAWTASYNGPARDRRAAKPWWLTVPAVLLVLLTAIGGLFVLAFRSRVSSYDPRAISEALMRERMRKVPLNTGLYVDPVEVQARQELERLRREFGVGTAPVGPDGRVHLRGGGSISPEEWERAMRSLEK